MPAFLEAKTISNRDRRILYIKYEITVNESAYVFTFAVYKLNVRR